VLEPSEQRPGGRGPPGSGREQRIEQHVGLSTASGPGVPGAMSGPVIDAWDVETGQPRWQIALQAAGATSKARPGRPETASCTSPAVDRIPAAGARPWPSGQPAASVSGARDIYASRTGTPSLAGDLLILPGSHRLPLAAISIHDGRLVWQQTRWTGLEFVHAASVGKEGFTVNTKYRGGAFLHDTTTGERRRTAASEIDLAGQGHTCGTIVLLASGMRRRRNQPRDLLHRRSNGRSRVSNARFRLADLPEPRIRRRTHVLRTPGQRHDLLLRTRPGERSYDNALRTGE
jgi:hypothetical protein